MTGPEHYQAAESCLKGVEMGEHDDGSPAFRKDEPETLAAGLIHALLAQAAATALAPGKREGSDPIVAEWWRVAS